MVWMRIRRRLYGASPPFASIRPPTVDPTSDGDIWVSYRRERLLAECHQLREDERYWLSRALALGSVYVAVAGGTVFFLLHGGVTSVNMPQWRRDVINMFLPAPTFAVIAIVIRHAVAATVRGRLLVAYERALIREWLHYIPLASGGRVPVGSTYHAQVRWLQGGHGGVLSIFECLPLFLAILLCYFAGAAISSTPLLIVFIVMYTTMMVVLLAIGYDGFISPVVQSSFSHLETVMERGACEAVPHLDASETRPPQEIASLRQAT